MEKLNVMRDRVAAKLADASLYEDDRREDRIAWEKKYTEVMDGLDRAEALWVKAAERLERAEAAA